MIRQITSIPEGMTWEDFSIKFEKFFPLSDSAKRIQKLEAEYERLTGKKPVKSGKAKRTQPAVREVNASGNGGKNISLSKGPREHSNPTEHGPTLSGEGLEGEKTSGV